MATPNEQHAARGGRARVVGSANQDGREPLVEAAEASDALQRSLDAASGEPRSPDSGAAAAQRSGAADDETLHEDPRAAPSQDNTDVRA